MLLITVITAAQTYAASGRGLPAAPARGAEHLLLPGQLGSQTRQLPEQQELTRAVPSWPGSQHSVPAGPAASGSSAAPNTACCPPGWWGSRERGKARIPLENTPRSLAKLGVKQERVFSSDGFSSGSFADLLFHQPGMRGNAGRFLCGVF